MRILQITAGAASMYCGSCFRDNALAAALKAQGHDVILVPLYTPTLTDEDNVSNQKVFFGGISIYLEHHSALFRHTPWLLDKIWDSGWALKMAAKSTIPVDPKFLGELTVDVLDGRQGRLRKELDKLLDWLRNEPRPDIVALPYTLVLSLAAPLKQLTGAPIVCTLQGEDLFIDGLQEPYRTRTMRLIREHIPYVDCFTAVSTYYARYMSGYLGIPQEKIEVVPLGIRFDGYPQAPPEKSEPFRIGYFARVAPEKGLHLLAEAFHRVRAEIPDARLEVAGYLAPEHRAYLDGIERQIREWGWGKNFKYHGTVDRERKIAFLSSCHVLSVPSPYRDPKATYCLESMAAGTPVVSPRHGALTEIVERTGGGVLVEPMNTNALAEALIELARDRDRLSELAGGGHAAVRREYPVERMAARAIEVYSRLTEPMTVNA
jgi:glycosyltransferase involved in cell wall biosynthesis